MLNIAKYLTRRAAVRPLENAPRDLTGYDRVVVIPALDEAETLPGALQALAAQQPSNQLARTLVLVVVNHRAVDTVLTDQRGEHQRQLDANAATLAWLQVHAAALPYALAWVDATSPGHEFPAKGGVGLARKTGCDSLIAALAAGPSEPDLRNTVIFSLDADTLVEPTYLQVAAEFLASGKAGGVLPVRHQPAESPAAQAAIDAYETYLQYYVDGLRRAGSPYAFLSVGSAMLFTAAAYVQAAGFPGHRQAGEDFYFLQELAKQGGICELRGTEVHPSPRISRRVPFGTGPRMAEALIDGKTEFLAYDPRCFAVLREVLMAVYSQLDGEPAGMLAGLTSPAARSFLEARGFPEVWGKFHRQFRTPAARRAAFDRWFDGFVTLKLIHHLTDTVWPRRPLAECLPPPAMNGRGDR